MIKRFTCCVILLITFSSFSSGKYDAVIIAPNRIFNYIQNDAVKVLTSKKDINRIKNAFLFKKYFNCKCGYDYDIYFSSKGEIVKSELIYIRHERKIFINKLRPYFPGESDSFRCYTMTVKSNSNIDSIYNLLNDDEYLLEYHGSLQKYPKVEFYISGKDTCTTGGYKECLPVLRRSERQLKKRIKLLKKEIRQFQPLEINVVTGNSASGPNFYKKSFIIRYWTKEPNDNKSVEYSKSFNDIIDSTNITNIQSVSLMYITERNHFPDITTLPDNRSLDEKARQDE